MHTKNDTIIIPYKSVGIYKIGNNINEYIDYFLKRNVYPEMLISLNNDVIFQIKIDNLLAIVYNEDDIIISITVFKDFDCHYNNIKPLMSISSIKELRENKQIIYFHNRIFFPETLGIALNLPDKYDDVDILEDIPNDECITSITISNFDYIKDIFASVL